LSNKPEMGCECRIFQEKRTDSFLINRPEFYLIRSQSMAILKEYEHNMSRHCKNNGTVTLSVFEERRSGGFKSGG
jgi:hypothetical protein